LNPEDGTNRLSRNVCTKLPLFAAQYPRRAQFSAFFKFYDQNSVGISATCPTFPIVGVGTRIVSSEEDEFSSFSFCEFFRHPVNSFRLKSGNEALFISIQSFVEEYDPIKLCAEGARSTNGAGSTWHQLPS